MSAAAGQVGVGPERSQRYWGLLGGSALCVIAVARALSPDARGFGTHIQLGLPPCVFQAWTGLPCPACGLTTCFAHMARGQLAAAAAANTFGVLLFTIVLALPPSAVWAVLRKRAFFETFARMQLSRVCIGLASLALFHWLVRVACVLAR